MALQLLINGTDRTDSVAFGSLSMRDNINEQVDTCHFTVREYGTHTLIPEVNQTVILLDGSTRIFAGVITLVSTSTPNAKIVEHDVTCKDWSQHLDRQIVTERYAATDAKAVIDDLISRYAAQYGFTGTNVGGASVTIGSVSFGEIPMSDCLNKLARLTGYYWYVDEYKDIHFFEKNDETAPFDLTVDGGKHIWDSVTIKGDLSQIRNRVKIRGGEARSDPRTTLKTGDGETDIFGTESKFAEKPTVTVDGVVQTVGIDFLNQDTDFDCMWDYQQKYIRFTAGNIPSAPASGTTNIEIYGIPLRPIVVQKQDNSSIAKYGLYEFRLEDRSIKTRSEALDVAQAQLDSYSSKIRAGSFSTYTPGLKSGQTIGITLPGVGVAEDFVIQAISFQQISPTLHQWNVEVASQRTLGIVDVLQKLLLKEKIDDGSEDVLLNFFNFADGIQFSDAIGTPTKKTTKNYYWVNSSETTANPMIWNKFTWA